MKRRAEVLTFFTNCDLRIKALIQKSILVNYAIRGNENCSLSIRDDINGEENKALLRLEVYSMFKYWPFF